MTPDRRALAEAALKKLAGWCETFISDPEPTLATIRAALALLPTQEEAEAMRRFYDGYKGGCDYVAVSTFHAYLDRLRGTETT